MGVSLRVARVLTSAPFVAGACATHALTRRPRLCPVQRRELNLLRNFAVSFGLLSMLTGLGGFYYIGFTCEWPAGGSAHACLPACLPPPPTRIPRARPCARACRWRPCGGDLGLDPHRDDDADHRPQQCAPGCARPPLHACRVQQLHAAWQLSPCTRPACVRSGHDA